MSRIYHQRNISRGAASIEAVVALPVFVILFIGVIFVRDLTGARLAADSEARRCAWEFSANGCSDIPVGCAGVVRRLPLGELDEDMSDTWEAGVSALENGNVQGAIITALTRFVLVPLTSAFTQRLEANKTLERTRPNVFGGGTSQVSGRYRLSCNLKSKSQQKIIDDVWSSLIPGGD